jgi:hypothetical protein
MSAAYESIADSTFSFSLLITKTLCFLFFYQINLP